MCIAILCDWGGGGGEIGIRSSKMNFKGFPPSHYQCVVVFLVSLLTTLAKDSRHAVIFWAETTIWAAKKLMM